MGIALGIEMSHNHILSFQVPHPPQIFLSNLHQHWVGQHWLVFLHKTKRNMADRPFHSRIGRCLHHETGVNGARHHPRKPLPFRDVTVRKRDRFIYVNVESATCQNLGLIVVETIVCTAECAASLQDFTYHSA